MKKVFAMVVTLLFGVLLAPSALAADPPAPAPVAAENRPGWSICEELPEGDDYDQLRAAAGCGDRNTVDQRVGGAISVVIWAVAVVAVMMIIYGGMQYVLSSGDAGKTKKARDTILYAVIGLVVALMAQALVYFVFSAIWSS